MSSRESTRKTLLVALCLCVVCSIVVSGTAVILKPMQDENRILDRNKNILAAAGLFDPAIDTNDDVARLFESFTPRVLDLGRGRLMGEEELENIGINIDNYDQRSVINNPDYSEALTATEDIAGIKRRVTYPMIYLVENENGLDTVVLPVNGYGLWGILYGFIALEGDANTVKGLSFYELKETPGLGAEVRNPNWTALWPGKKVYSADNSVALRVVKGRAAGEQQIDGLSGATLTTQGVDNLIQYWLGEQGYGPFLRSLNES